MRFQKYPDLCVVPESAFSISSLFLNYSFSAFYERIDQRRCQKL